MRNRFLLIPVALLIVFSGTDAKAGEIKYGAKAGMILSAISQTPIEWEEEKSLKPGFTGGVFLNYAINESFSLQPELLYTQKGVGGSLYEGIINVDLTASFDYFELPVLAIYAFSTKGDLKPFIYGGPGFAYNLSSELEVSALIFSGAIDFSSLTHTTDFIFVAGAGFEYTLGGGTLILDARFQLGFTNVLLSGDFEINGSTQTISEDDFKNFGFALMVGYGL